MKIECEFQGGLSVLFGDQFKIEVEIQENSDIKDLIIYLEKNHIKRTPEMFTIENHQL